MSEVIDRSQAVATPDPEVQVTAPDLSVDEQIDKQIEVMMAQNRGNVNNQIYMQEVKIFPHHVEVEVRGIKKAISLMDFKNMIDQQLQLESQLQTLALPYNTYLFARSNNEIHISCYYPERRMDLKYHRSYETPTTYKNCLLPNIVISHKLKLEEAEWRVVDTRYMATSKRVTELPEDKILWAPEGEGMWRVPFPNFYNDFRMCFGGNTMPMRYKNNLRGLDYYYQVISVSPFNNDLGINVRDTEISKWFEELPKLETFPYNRLISTARW